MTKTRKSQFRKLVDRARYKGVPKGEKPVSYIAMAKRCRTSRPFFYALMAGKQVASKPYELRIAKGLGVSADTVHRAIAS